MEPEKAFDGLLEREEDRHGRERPVAWLADAGQADSSRGAGDRGGNEAGWGGKAHMAVTPGVFGQSVRVRRRPGKSFSVGWLAHCF
jgi:hypothetical protein